MVFNSGFRWRRAVGAVRMAVEALDRRVLFDSTFVPILPTAFQQHWDDTSQISSDDNWSGDYGRSNKTANTTYVSAFLCPSDPNNGGNGTIIYFAPRQALVVRQTVEVRGDLTDVLRGLRD